MSHKALVLLLVLMLVGAIYLAQKQVGLSTQLPLHSNGLGNQCEFVNLQCHFEIDNQPASASFNTSPVTEEAVTVYLSLPNGVQIESVWIEGINMYMGKIPVLAERLNAGEWEGWFMLGSCSEPEMRWLMRVNIKGRSEPALLYFTTS